jgi:hypothetical protein
VSQAWPAAALPISTQLVSPSSRTTLHVVPFGHVPLGRSLPRSTQCMIGMQTGIFVAVWLTRATSQKSLGLGHAPMQQ